MTNLQKLAGPVHECVGVTPECHGPACPRVTPSALGDLGELGDTALKLVLSQLERLPSHGTIKQTIQREQHSGRVHVFPLREGMKTPLLKGGCNGATSDPAAVTALWQRYPTANLGLATGHGLVAIDIDPRNGGTVDEALPATYCQTTPSGGIHLLYTTTLDIPNSASRLAPGVDVRGVGGHIVHAPSWTTGVDGKRRYWTVVDDRPPVPMPDWLADACINGVPDASGRRPSRSFLPSEDPITEGSRNEYVARFVGWAIASGIEGDDLIEFVANENATMCDPPLEASEVQRVVSNICRRERDRVAAEMRSAHG
jgi:putative DNA primase/helicase